MAHSFHQNLVHIVFSTKNREKLIHAAWENRLHSYLGGIVKSLGGIVLAIGGTHDHVHLLVSTSATTSDADFMKTLKSCSSKWVKEQNLEKQFAWQEGYGWFSIGASMIDNVRGYIRTQKKRHQKITFREEFLRLLKKYHVEFDERYLWK